MARGTIERVGRAEIQLSHLDKPFFPADGISKGDLVGYYREMAPLITGYLRDRPLVMGRYPDGIAGQGIVQKNAPRHFPGWVTVTDVPKRDGTVRHVVGDKPETLVYLANQGCVELHAFLSRRDALDTPDQLVFDLDPPDDAGFGQACEHALGLRELLAGELGLGSYVKTTGGKGLHVHVMLRPADDFDSVRGFAREIAALLASRHPGELTVEQRKNQRGRRLYLDVMRNAYAQTAIAPYAVRARPGAPVATPLHWAELESGGLSPRRFTLRTMAGLLPGRDDPWQDMTRHRHRLTGASRRLAALARPRPG